MTKIIIQYEEHHEDSELIETKEEAWHSNVIPRIGEEIYLEGNRMVIGVKHYRDKILVETATKVDYPALTETAKRRLRAAGINPENLP